jgi:hypothetical protein
MPPAPLLVKVRVLMSAELAWYVYVAVYGLSVTVCNRPAVS